MTLCSAFSNSHGSVSSNVLDRKNYVIATSAKKLLPPVCVLQLFYTPYFQTEDTKHSSISARQNIDNIIRYFSHELPFCPILSLSLVLGSNGQSAVFSILRSSTQLLSLSTSENLHRASVSAQFLPLST